MKPPVSVWGADQRQTGGSGAFAFRKRRRRSREPSRARIAAGALVAAALLAGCAGAGTAALRLEDPRGDDHGPGTYVYPTGDLYAPGTFDLRGVALRRDGDDLLVEVAFARPVVVARGVRLASDLVADLFVPTVDVYLDLDGVPGQGLTEGLPGRGVTLAPPSGWEAVIVLSPMPERVAPLYERFASRAVVAVPRQVRVRGRSLVARVPRAVVDIDPARVGVAVAVTATVFGVTFRTKVEGQVPTAFVREITAVPGRCGRWDEDPDGAPCTFGGCAGCGAHPRVIDALWPERGVQERLLAGYDTEAGRLGVLPMVYPPGAAPAALAGRPGDRWAVTSRRGAILTVHLPEGEAAPAAGALGDGLDASGRAAATVAVLASVGEGLLTVKVVDGDPDAVTSVRFASKNP